MKASPGFLRLLKVVAIARETCRELRAPGDLFAESHTPGALARFHPWLCESTA